MRKMKKQLPKAQSGLFKLFNPKNWKAAAKAFQNNSKLIYKADGTLDNRFKVNRESSSFHSAKNKGTGKSTGKSTKTENVKNEPGVFSKAINYNLSLPSIKQVLQSPYTIPKAGLTAAYRNPKTTALLGANTALAYYLLKRGDGTKDIDLKDQFNFDQDLNTYQMDNTRVNLDSTRNPNFTPNINNKMYLFEKKGGPVRAKGGKIAPGMKSKGGGLKMDKNGKFYR